MIRHAAITFFGLGCIRFAPGSWASLGAIAVAGLLLWILRAVDAVAWFDPIIGALLVMACAGSVVWGRWAIDYFADRARKPGDPGPFVLDEVAGQWLSILALPMGRISSLWVCAAVYAMQFLLFRVLDIVKPPPGRQLEKLPDGWGVLMDDLGVAIYVNLIGQIVVRWWLASE
jgi:phosphatidylglycerophosphatase A